MNIGISWDAYCEEIEFERQVEIYKENGITNTFLMSEEKDFENLVPKIQKNNIIIDTLHAPFRGEQNINALWLRGRDAKKMMLRLKDGIDKCEKFGIPVLVVHVSSGDKAPHINDLGYKRFSSLYEYSQKKNVKLAFENQRKIANLAFMLEQFENAGFCWDCGHEAAFAYGRQYMPMFGERLCALHIHDNFGKHNGDNHMIPFDAGIDFERVTSQIASSGYTGTMMLELGRNHTDFYKNCSPEEYFKKGAEAAKKLAKMTEEKRNKIC